MSFQHKSSSCLSVVQAWKLSGENAQVFDWLPGVYPISDRLPRKKTYAFSAKPICQARRGNSRPGLILDPRKTGDWCHRIEDQILRVHASPSALTAGIGIHSVQHSIFTLPCYPSEGRARCVLHAALSEELRLLPLSLQFSPVSRQHWRYLNNVKAN